MSTCIINPARSKGEPALPAIGILAVNPSDSSSFPMLARQFVLKKHFLFNAQLYINNTFFLAGPAVGAPMAAICLEKLIALGARRIIVYGWCGSLHMSLRSGELYVPTGGLSEEGTSGHYPMENRGCDDSLRLWLIETLTRQGYRPKQGQIWTTDAVYRETREKVERFGAKGIWAVDMEFTALDSIAAFRRISFAAVMLVSDELFHRDWTPQFQHKQFRLVSRNMLEKLCTIIHTGETS
jgi:uridine phosphorylase